MQVSHTSDYDTHAVIGGKEVQEFGMAQTKEMYDLLSTALYSNKPLAVVREILCNAWDSHIVSNRKHLPIVISIDDDKMSIRDYGTGIPHDKLHATYCFYGKSTKENDGNQTGGFGLGSKAPFAYNDHFTVVNHFNGIKTVNAISRGSALTEGKPDRRVMVSVPTTETGIEVMIPIKNPQDAHNFIEIAKDIAAFGEMNVLINGKSVEIVPISSAENNMFITNRRPRGTYNAINIRYGNVIYPVNPEDEYIGVYSKLKKLLDDIPSRDHYKNNNDLILIMQAPANSISVTPSRESLSNTETTVKTITKIFSDLIEYMSTGSDLFEERLLAEHSKAIEHMWSTGYEDRIMFADNLLSDSFGPKKIKEREYGTFTQINTMLALANYYLQYNTKLSANLKNKLLEQRINSMIAHDYRRMSDLKKFMKFNFQKSTRNRSEELFSKEIINPLLKRVAKTEMLKPKNMYLVTPAHNRNNRHGWLPLEKYKPDDRKFLNLLQGVVVVTHNKIAYEDDWNARTGLGDTIPNDIPRFVYVAPRTKGHKDAAVELFTRLGYHVVDFAKILDDYKANNQEERVRKTRDTSVESRPRNQGLVLLSNNVIDHSFSINGHMVNNMPRSKDYEYVVKPYNISAHYDAKFFPWGDNMAKDIVKMFGSNIGVCVSAPQYDKQIREGKKDGFKYIVETICNKILTCPDIRTYVENEKGVEKTSSNFDYLLQMAALSTILSKAFKLPSSVNEGNLIYYEMYNQLTPGYYRSPSVPTDDSWQKITWDTKQVIDKWTATPAFSNLESMIKKSKGLKMLHMYDLLCELRSIDKVNPDYKTKIFIETTIINALKI